MLNDRCAQTCISVFLVSTIVQHEALFFTFGTWKIQDSEAYACLLNVLAPECSAKPSAMSVKDLLHRARLVLEHADRMGCKRYLTPKDIVDGLPNLNLAFVAHIFQKRYDLFYINYQKSHHVFNFIRVIFVLIFSHRDIKYMQ